MRDMSLCGVKEAAQILGVSRATAHRMVDAGQLPYVQKLPGPKGQYLLRRSTVEKLAKKTAA
jgi:excisionase family DNA binding protein